MFSIAKIRKPTATHRMVCVEVSSSHLRLGIVNGQRTPDARSELTLDEVRWRVEALSLLTDTGAAELGDAFRLLIQRHELRGAAVHVSLSGELCVSRVASGDPQHVSRELLGFESRCQRYLCLGHGRKAHASRIEPHKGGHHGMLTAANHHVAEAIEKAARESGVELAGIEPAVTSISRLMGDLDDDRDNPLLLINLDGQGVEFSLCHEGRPLVQFRPAPGYRPEDAGDAAQSNMSRLRRNCQRYAGFHARLRQVFVIGPREQTAPAVESLQAASLPSRALADRTTETSQRASDGDQESLELFEFSPALVPGVDLRAHEATTIDGRFAAVLGLASLSWLEHDRFGPDLLAAIDRTKKNSWGQRLRKHWMVAAVLIIAASLQGLSHLENARVELLTAAHQVDPVSSQLVTTRLAIGRLRGFELRFASLAKQCEQGDLAAFTEQVAHCLPNTVWLTGVELYVDGSLTLRGKTQNEAAIYHALDVALRRSPNIASLSLNSTSTPDHYGSVNFELRGSRRMANEVNSESN